ncbi:PAS domain-containing protein [Ancylothrix sp. C2]|uniref:PAS domain-containing protein n=1 Tax=Ancylothrix sp. D3o TaxID=2953691 RepID=UPI0021BB7ACF|nr:PAS domain-containing protein [Ancylothrix sp. D3o]MCT7949578.1 PAS domain-containing protein [Ancylothrix sp. D3o]
MLKTISEILETSPGQDMLWLYDRALAATSTGIVIADAKKPNRPLIYCNDAFVRMTGYTLEDTIGKNCKFLQGPDTDPAAVEEIRQALREERECKVVLKNYRKNGSYFWNELTISPVRDSEGNLTNFIGVQNDITARVEAEMKLKEKTAELAESETALRKQTQILQSILDSLAEGVLVADETGQFLFFNPAAQQLLGQSFAKVNPQNWSEKFNCYLPDGMTPYPWEELPLTLAIQGRPVDGAEVYIQPPNQSEKVCISVNARPLKDETGNIKGGVAVFRDITDKKQALEALEKSEAQLRNQTMQLKKTLHDLQDTQAKLIHSEKMSSLGQLVAGIAHEINNPINFIYGNLVHTGEYVKDLVHLVSLYQQYYPNAMPEIQEKSEEFDVDFLLEDLPKLLQSMLQGSERIRQIVLNLRNFSRLDEAEVKQVDIHTGLESALLILQHRLASTQQRPEIKIVKEYGNLPKIECHAGSLNQVFMNILSNAIDAIEIAHNNRINQPEIKIMTCLEKGRIIMEITDNGIGMSEQVYRHLFDPFFTTKPVGSGRGLGLWVSYQIVVEKHGGELKCISEFGKGTKVIIELPLRQEKL